MIARVKGSRSVTIIPAPGVLVMSIDPRSPSMLRRTTSIPTPRPDRSVTSRAVEKPGAQNEREHLGFRELGFRRDETFFDGARANRIDVESSAVIGYPDQHMRPRVSGGKVNTARSGLPGRQASRRALRSRDPCCCESGAAAGRSTDR